VQQPVFLAHRLLIDIPYKDIKEITGPNRIEQLFKTASGELVRPIGRYELHMKLARRHPFSHTFFKCQIWKKDSFWDMTF
jgi:hypothetical protein